MKHKILVALAAFAVAVTVVAQEKGGDDVTGPYNVVAGWPQNYCGDGFVIGSTAGIWAESPDRVYIFSRGCLPALKRSARGGGQLHSGTQRVGLRHVAEGPDTASPLGSHLQHRRSQRQPD